jgi:membrane fusion protein, multidrug efflux system
MQTEKKFLSFTTLTNLFAIAIVIAGIGFGIWFLNYHNSNEETNDAQVEQYITPIMSRIPGHIKEIKYEENQFVKKGDTLIVIEDAEYRALFYKAKAEYENAILNENVEQRNVITTQNSTLTRKAQLEEAKSKVWQLELDYKRYKDLVIKDAAPAQKLEQVEAEYRAALGHLHEIESEINSATFATEAVKAKVPMMNALVESKKAALDNASLYYSYTVITAPYDGYVGKKTIQPGQLIKAEQSLVSMVSKEKWVIANFKETQFGRLGLNQEVTFRVDAFGNKKFNGVIESFSPASGARFSLLPPDNATGNFIKIEQRIPVRIKIVGSQEELASLRAGMNVTVTAANK